jgi:hypothetical protein
MDTKTKAEDLYKKLLYYISYASTPKAAKLSVIAMIDEIALLKEDAKYWQEVKKHIQSIE